MSLRERYDAFHSDLVPWQDEVIANQVQGKGQQEFVDGLTAIFRESNRVLKDNGLFVFTFHHRDPKSWGSVLQAVLDSGFYVTTTYPIRSEMRASTHLHDVSNITIDLVFVCKKKQSSPPTKTWKEIRRKMIQLSKGMVEEYMESNDEVGNRDIFAMVLGKCLSIFSQFYPNIVDQGANVGIAQVIDAISEITETVMFHK